MSMRYVRDAYGVPAKRGMYVEVYQRSGGGWVLANRGRITSAGHYIRVDGARFHPTDGVVYYDSVGQVLCDTRDRGGGTG